MKKLKLIQALTLFCFISFITVFILYRTGSFDKYFLNERSQYQTSPNGGNVNTLKTDSLKGAKTDSVSKLFLSSSKSAYMIIPKKFILSDSVKAKTNLLKFDAIGLRKEKGIVIMSGSKSGPIFTPEKQAVTPLKFDPRKLKGDTLKK